MNSITVNGFYAYSKETTIEMLHGFGMDDMDIETMQTLLNEEELEEAQYEANVWKQEYEALEAHTESVQMAMNEVLNIIDEMLEMQRITKAREKLEAMRTVIMNAQQNRECQTDVPFFVLKNSSC